jgi:hypothetical protein
MNRRDSSALSHVGSVRPPCNEVRQLASRAVASPYILLCIAADLRSPAVLSARHRHARGDHARLEGAVATAPALQSSLVPQLEACRRRGTLRGFASVNVSLGATGGSSLAPAVDCRRSRR